MNQLPPEMKLAHRVLNRILVQVRWLIGEHTDHQVLYDILDRIELLPSLLNEPAGVHDFIMHVTSLAQKYPAFQLALDEIDREGSVHAVG